MNLTLSSKTGLILGACLIAATSTVLAATPSSLTEKRGYSLCVDTVERDLPDLRPDSVYYTNTHASSREFYLNGRATRDGEWGEVRITCETTRSGHKVLEVSHEPGRYLGRTSVALANN